MKRAAFLFLVGLVTIGAAALAIHRENDCNARGGVMVQGQFDYVCVAAARVAP